MLEEQHDTMETENRPNPTETRSANEESDSKNDPTRLKKRQKVNAPSEIKRCQYVLKNKGRKCGTQVRADMEFCYYHVNAETEEQKNVSSAGEGFSKTLKNGRVVTRVACPVDPSHSVWSNKLQKHLKNCNFVKKKQDLEDRVSQYSWLEIDYNVKDGPCCEDTDKTEDINYEEFKQFVDNLIVSHDKVFADSELTLNQVDYRNGLENRFSELTNKKHIVQQSSLIGQLAHHNLLSRDNLYIEFGCGRGEFSRYLNRALMCDSKLDGTTKSLRFLLVDRESPRMKFDFKMSEDFEEFKTQNSDRNGVENVDVQRLKVDIKDLILVESLKKFEQTDLTYVGISKHLCGVATDLTLRCLLNSVNQDSSDFHFGGFLVAMCCRHACRYEWLLEDSRRYLQEKFQLNKQNFHFLKKMVCWATNGILPGLKEEDGADHFTGLNFGERAIVGLKARRILDESRVFAMTQRGFDAQLVNYVTDDLTKENTCMLVKPSTTL